MEAVDTDVVKRFVDKNKHLKINLMVTDKNAKEHFSKCSDYIIMKADEGGTTVILDVKDYIENTNKQLQDNSFYQTQNVDPIVKHSEIVNSPIESFRKQGPLLNTAASKLIVDAVKNTSIPYFSQSL